MHPWTLAFGSWQETRSCTLLDFDKVSNKFPVSVVLETSWNECTVHLRE